MKHNAKIIVLILCMFLVTQIIGLYVINYYSPTKVVNNNQINVTNPNALPLGLEPPPENQNLSIWAILLSVIPMFIVAVLLFFLLAKFKSDVIIKAWFFVVVIIALSVSLFSFLPKWAYIWIVVLAMAIPLAFFKVYKRNFIIHNLTELLIYPGIAAVFVALLSSPESPNRGIFAMIAILFLISIYDMWAVWRSKIMQKMAKYDVNRLKIFPGFLIPSMSKEDRKEIKNIKLSKSKTGKSKSKKMKVSIALLGGGDIVFPLIAAGVVLRRFGFTNVLGMQLPVASLIVTLFSIIGLGSLFIFSKKDKYYPAMPFISAGALTAIGLCYLIF